MGAIGAGKHGHGHHDDHEAEGNRVKKVAVLIACLAAMASIADMGEKSAQNVRPPPPLGRCGPLALWASCAPAVNLVILRTHARMRSTTWRHTST